MHEFEYRDSMLYCEGISITDIAKQYPTPFYLYSYKTLMDHYRKIKEAFKELDPLICFSMKSNSNLNICRALVNEGAGLDIVSGGELFKAGKVGCPANKIVYASVGKTEREIEAAIKKNILFFNVESIPELIMIDTVAKRLKKKPRVALRLNPDVKADTHDYITTGTKEKKFGIDFQTAENIFDNANKYSNVLLKGVHVHIGSQITDTEPFKKAITKVLEFIDKSKINIEYLNIGGGFGIIYKEEKARTAMDFAAQIIPLLKDKPYKLILEPGRFIVGNSGALITKVLYVKTTSSGKNFAIIDAGMNDLIRPSLYEAYHEILPVVQLKAEVKKYDVVGPICESGDYLALDREFPEIIPDQYLAVMSAGAYGYAMASNYNSRPRPAELMVMNGEVKIIRRAEMYNDLIRCDKMIKELK
ncbi:MAG TPA: diaminopimelate decarboxylase [Candidatus Omnitrophota bacterium]|nr:diaminopimelate decarboxylase [Candidatus Omnitrophota bacterium]HPS20700.1 diaminopimelate decarboxylase [Candidatus Omnitrophota bacterium]